MRGKVSWAVCVVLVAVLAVRVVVVVRDRGAGAGAGAPVLVAPGTVVLRQARVQRVLVGGQRAVLLRPRRASGRLVVYVHGSGEPAEAIVTDPSKQQLIAGLLQAGFTVAASDAHGDAWGSEASVNDYVHLVNRMRQIGVRGQVDVIAQSMGGLAGTLLIDRVHVHAWAGIYPVCDLRSILGTGRYTRQIDRAYGVVPSPGQAWVPAGRSPVTAHRITGVRMRFWASPADRTVPMSANARRCATNAERRGARVTLTSTHGPHGDRSNFDPAAIQHLFH